ncbi:MAG: tetratricopeptide repeat protein [Novosphingobium sp.]|uniref:tetratricopeptide repeat protein n=1 Tax=Novosphingobium sp. TaxID=1874826 RepID=UPI0027332221|nr:tetratricopeptide repeat protein [Novosphingobium sp.]MDP3550070.1 tetratricopeptide repeat protein [Novosphingobium sp.]
MRLLAVVLGVLASSGTVDFAQAETMPVETARSAIDQAGTAIRGGKPTDAIVAVEPVIAALEEQQKAQTVQCADGGSQTIMLLLMQAAASEKLPKAEQRNAVVIDSAFCTALFLKGFALIDLQRWDDAEPFLRRAHDAAPLNAQYLNEYAEWHNSMKQRQKSHDLFEQAFDLGEFDTNKETKTFNQARSLRGMAYTEIEMGQLDKAEKNLRKSLKLIPNHPGAKSELEYIAELRKKAKE